MSTASPIKCYTVYGERCTFYFGHSMYRITAYTVLIILPIICFFASSLLLLELRFKKQLLCTNKIIVIDAFARERPFCAVPVPVSCYIAKWILLQS